jgi:hypothetical protein
MTFATIILGSMLQPAIEPIISGISVLANAAAPLPPLTLEPLPSAQPNDDPNFNPLEAVVAAFFEAVSATLGLIGEKWLVDLQFWLRTIGAALLPSILLALAMTYFMILPNSVSFLDAVLDFVDMPVRGYLFFAVVIMLGGIAAALASAWLQRRRDRKQIMKQTVFE